MEVLGSAAQRFEPSIISDLAFRVNPGYAQPKGWNHYKLIAAPADG